MLRRKAQGGIGRGQPAPLPLPALLVVVALVAAVGAMGGYAWPLQVAMGLLLALALVLARRSAGGLRLDRRLAPTLVAAAVLAIWAVLRGALEGGAASGAAAGALLAGIVVVVLIGRLLSAAERESLAVAAVALGLLVAVTGIVGVALHLEPWALPDQRLWRAASSLTYANAAGGLLAPLALLSAAGLVARPRAVARLLTTTMLLAGLGATMSRGGLAALLAGAAVLAALVGVRPLLREVWPPVLGAAVVVAGLVPSLPVGRPPAPVTAAIGLAAGLTTAVLAGRPRARPVVLGVALAGALAAAPLVLDVPAAPRLTLASPDRVDELRAAFRLVAERPLVGVGPGRAQLVLPSPDGSFRVARYVHNEYVQVLAEFGAIGAALLATLLGTAAWLLVRSRPAAREPVLWAGVVAGLAGFALHSAVDFLWHLPVLPLTAALLFGLALPVRKGDTCSTAHRPGSLQRSSSDSSSHSLLPSSRR